MSQESKILLALAGNPNCGKTTIFNNITGARQHVGNYPGVTVERVVGKKKFNGKSLEIIDLPGTYSLTARSMDEIVARRAIVTEDLDVLVDVVDCSNLERNLYLTAQLIELEVPMVFALNMIDVAEKWGLEIDQEALAKRLGGKVIPTVGRTNKGTKALLEAITEVGKGANEFEPVKINYGEEIENSIATLEEFAKSCNGLKYPSRWIAIKLLENDKDLIEQMQNLEGAREVLAKAVALRAELADKFDLETIFQEQRHKFAVDVFNSCTKSPTMHMETTSDKIDKILTHRIFGLPIFIGIMYALFQFVFTVGEIPQGWIEEFFEELAGLSQTYMEPGQLQSLVENGIIGGVGAVLSFLPLVVILFLGIAFLEDTGYMARAAFIMDRIMRAFGLHGKSFIPMILGFGCTVPAVMGARILDNPKDRIATILVSPFMSCGAKLPVYVLLIGAFFPTKISGLMLLGVYLFGVFLAIIFAKIFRSTILAGEMEPFVMELPPYHMPTFKTVLLHMWERTWMYIRKAGTFILATSILVWFLVAYPLNVQYSQDYDALEAKVEQTYEQKNSEILATLNLNSIEEDEALVAVLADMNEKYEAAQEAEEEEVEEAVEEEDVHDRILHNEMVEEEPAFPETFAEIEKENPQLYPTAIKLFENELAMADELDAISFEKESEKLTQSYAGRFGKAIEPIVAPLGFDWKVGVGIVSSMAAKEVMISTLGTIYSIAADDEDNAGLQEILVNDPNFTPAVALSLMAFVLVYPPCIAALAVIKKETSLKWMAFVFAYGNIFSWVTAFIVYRVSLLLGLGV